MQCYKGWELGLGQPRSIHLWLHPRSQVVNNLVRGFNTWLGWTNDFPPGLMSAEVFWLMLDCSQLVSYTAMKTTLQNHVCMWHCSSIYIIQYDSNIYHTGNNTSVSNRRSVACILINKSYMHVCKITSLVNSLRSRALGCMMMRSLIGSPSISRSLARSAPIDHE